MTDADVVQAQGARRQLFLGVDVHPMTNAGDLSQDGADADLQIIDAAGDKFGLRHPDDGGLELIGGFQRRVCGGQNIAARDIDLVGGSQGDGLAGLCAVHIAAHDDDPFNARADAGWRDGEGIAYRDAAARDAARIAAEVEVGAVGALDRHTERPGRLGDGGQGLQNLQQGWPRVPFGRFAVLDQVVTIHAGDGDGDRCRQTSGFYEGEVIGDDGV